MTLPPCRLRTATATLVAIGLFAGCRDAGPAAVLPPPPGAFPDPATVPAGRLVPDAAAVAVAPGGHFTVEGRPRFLVGAQVLPAYIKGLRPTAGYPADLAWLYEKPLDFTAARRLGLDSIGYFASDGWVNAYAPGKANAFLFSPEELTGLGAMLRGARLPAYVDFTCFEWTNGALAAGARKAGNTPDAALNAGGSQGNTNHWVPYSATTPEGRALYTAMWKHGTAEARERGVVPLVYELFNEPGYDDPSPANRALFLARITARFATVEALNRAWGSSYPSLEAASRFARANENPGLQAEWGLFMEDAFVELCRLGRETVRAIAPGAPCGVQPSGMDCYRALGKGNINVWRLAAEMDIVGTGTGGGLNFSDGLAAPVAATVDTPDFDVRVVEGFLHHRFIRAVAGAKPVYDGESYAGTGVRTADALAGHLWVELARGCGATYLFAFERRTWDTLWKDHAEAGGRRLAEKFPWDLLNPYATPPQALTGIHDFKAAAAPVEDLLVPRANRVAGQVGLLLSLPSERIAPALPTTTHQQIRTYANALEFSHQPYDIVLEEQLSERAGGYRAIVAGGVRTAYAGTPAALRRYVAEGGTLILGLEALDADQYGQPRAADDLLGPPLGAPLPPAIGTLAGGLAPPAWLPGELRGQPWRAIASTEGWNVLASVGAQPAVLERRVGSGRIVYIDLRMPAYPLAGLLGTLLGQAGVQRLCDLRLDQGGGLAPNVEVHRFRAGGLAVDVLYNWDRYPKLVTLDLPAGHAAAVDAIPRRHLPVADGRVLAVLPPMAPTVIASGSGTALAGRFGACPAVGHDALEGEIAAWHPPAGAGRAVGLGPDFATAGHTYEMLDLRRHANRGFVDQVAGDGRGGWTDQGAGNSLEGTPWGRQELLGVPFEFIRTDENADRTCLVMRSRNMPGGADRIDGIPVGRQVNALCFLHTAAWCEGQAGNPAMIYVVHYADGGTAEIPIRPGAEIADWWSDRSQVGEARRAWRNVEQRSLFAWRWANPQPERLVTSFDVVSADGAAVGILVAATAELGAGRAEAPRTALPVGSWRAQGWLGVTAAVAQAGDGAVLTMAVGADAKDWCGASLTAPGGGIPAPEGGWPADGVLAMQLNGLADAWGAAQGGQQVQVSLKFRRADGTTADGGYIHLGGPAVDRDPATWQDVSLPLSRLAAGHQTEAILGVAIQFVASPPLAGLAVRGLMVSGR